VNDGDGNRIAAVRPRQSAGRDVPLKPGPCGQQNSLRAPRDGSILLALGILAHRVRQADFAEIIPRRIRLQGVMLGSRTDRADLIDFAAAHRLEPVVGRVYDGLDLAPPSDRGPAR
jgi:D-arabinose 1-dehydrogenase-like Zn-dependent alcohol dehydrogenase